MDAVHDALVSLRLNLLRSKCQVSIMLFDIFMSERLKAIEAGKMTVQQARRELATAMSALKEAFEPAHVEPAQKP